MRFRVFCKATLCRKSFETVVVAERLFARMRSSVNGEIDVLRKPHRTPEQFLTSVCSQILTQQPLRRYRFPTFNVVITVT